MNLDEMRSLYNQAYLLLNEEEEENLLNYYQKSIGGVKVFDKLDLGGIEPMEINTDMSLSLREDEVKESMDRDQALSYSDLREYGYFKLDRVVD